MKRFLYFIFLTAALCSCEKLPTGPDDIPDTVVALFRNAVNSCCCILILFLRD